MNLNRVVVLLAIFGALYYGYPKYQDKKNGGTNSCCIKKTHQ